MASSSKSYVRMPLMKYCFMADCKNNSKTCPEKQFLFVPIKNRAEWCRAAGLNSTSISNNLFICEDHLNLEEDMENYMFWKTMKATTKVNAKLKPRLPIFRTPLQETSNFSMEIEHKLDTSQEAKTDLHLHRLCQGVQCSSEVAHKKTQTKIEMSDRKTQCSIKLKKSIRKFHQKDSPINSSPGSVPSYFGSTSEVAEFDSTSETSAPGLENKELVGRKFMMTIINKRPMTYLGLPCKHTWIIDFLSNNIVTDLNIITTLYKIRNNDTFTKMADLFEVSLATLWRSYYVTLKMLSTFFRQLVYWPLPLKIKRTLPNAFKTNKEYAQIQAIIDCFEIEIEKSSNPVHQSLSWSQYKSCNTMKYLISATPCGFINFVSTGYGGRISDVRLVEESGFLQVVPPNCTILADRGFKHLDTTLNKQRVKLLRPPSVYSDTKPTKEEVLATKVIASLRVHIERVIRRVRVFKLLKPHSTVNNKLVNTLDDAVLVACGLINLQSPIIKSI